MVKHRVRGHSRIKCYVMQWGWGCQLSRKKALCRCTVQCYKALRGGWGQNASKKRYVTHEWPLVDHGEVTELVCV